VTVVFYMLQKCKKCNMKEVSCYKNRKSVTWEIFHVTKTRKIRHRWKAMSKEYKKLPIDIKLWVINNKIICIIIVF
jgi:hypothetical protein